MSNLKIPATDRSPEMDFDFAAPRLAPQGRILPRGRGHLLCARSLRRSTIISPARRRACSLRIRAHLLQQLERQGDHVAPGEAGDAAARGASVSINWYYDEEDDTMQELGEEFGEDLKHATFNVEKLDAPTDELQPVRERGGGHRRVAVPCRGRRSRRRRPRGRPRRAAQGYREALQDEPAPGARLRPQRGRAQRHGRETAAGGGGDRQRRTRSWRSYPASSPKYLSPQVYKSIFTGAQEVELASQRKKLTVFFSDIAGFTETTDKMESEDLTTVLNHYLTEMSKVALEHGATHRQI